MKHKKKAKAVAPAQALFDEMDGEASSDASSSDDSTPSVAEALAETDVALAGAEDAEFAATAPAIAARVEAEILAPRSSNYINVDSPLPPAAQEAEDDEPAGTQEDEDAPAGEEPGPDAAPPAAEAGQAGDAPATGRKNRESMENVALVFLEDALARRLAVAWEVCGGTEDDWFDAAGIASQQRQQARQIGRALRLHGICRDGGVTDQLALEYIRAVIARPLKAPAPAKKK